MKDHSDRAAGNRPGTGRGTSGSDRRGIALIIVLGMMAILMIMGVAFSISMRAERMGAGSFRFGVGSRHMVWAGLARAVDAIHENIATNGYMYPNFDLLPSDGFGSVRIAFGDSADFVPAALREKVQDAQSGWVVGGTAGGSSFDGSIQGRLAYLVVNVSGFLDANHAAGSNRWAGYGPAEIAITNLAEILDAADFVNARQGTDLRYETLQDLYVCQSNWGLSALPTNFVTYSKYPWGSYDGTEVRQDALDIGGRDRAGLNSIRADIISRLVASGIDEPGQAPFVFTNLLDYVDPSPVPTHLAAPNTKAVPMLNEMIVTGGVFRQDIDSDMFARAGVFLDVEWFYPFIAPSPHRFEVQTEATVILTNVTIGMASQIARTNTLPSGYNPYDPPNPGDTERYHVVRPPGFAPAPVPMSNTTDRVKVIANIRARIRLEGGGDIVDQVPTPWSGAAVEITSEEIEPPLGAPNMHWFAASRETIDPRFNWISTPFHWRDPAEIPGSPAGPSPGTTNAWTLDYWSNLADTVDTDSALHVAGRGHLVSAGELGNLLFEKMGGFWQTIRLLDHPALVRHRILENFTVHDTNTVRRGLVNVNTTNRHVLTSAFVGMPWGYPENTNDVMTLAEAGVLADQIIAFREAGGVFTNVSDLAALDWRAAAPDRRIVEHESAISHSYGLFGTRQNLFAVYVVAGPFAPGLGEVARRQHEQMGDWLGYQRALFHVWRDPFPNDQGKHRVFIQSFQWLTGGD